MKINDHFQMSELFSLKLQDQYFSIYFFLEFQKIGSCEKADI